VCIAPGSNDARVLDVCKAPGDDDDDEGDDDEVRMCAKPRATMDSARCVVKPRSMVDGRWSMEITDACDPVHSMNGSSEMVE